MKTNDEIIFDLKLHFQKGEITLTRGQLHLIMNQVRIDTLGVSAPPVTGERYVISRQISYGIRGRYVIMYFFGLDVFKTPIYSLDPRNALIFTGFYDAMSHIDKFELTDHRVVKLEEDGSTKPIKQKYDGEKD